MVGIHYLSVGDIDLGKINRWQATKASSITPISFPGQDSNKTQGVDTLGIIAYINIGGRIVGTFETLQNAIYDIRTILDGAQTTSSVLRSPFINSKLGASSTRIQGHIGVNTSTSANKLVDSNANFSIWGITTSDKVKDLTTGTVYTISSVDSDTQLTLSGDPFTSTGMPYAVTATMNVKVLSFDVVWGLPGLNYVDYTMSVMQVL